NPSVVRQSVTFTATLGVTPPGAGTPTGSIQFQIDNSTVTVPLIGTTGIFTTRSLTVGTHTVTATYLGDSSFASSSGSLPGGQVVNQASTKTATTTAVSSSANPSVVGQPLTFTAAVSAVISGAGTPTGTVLLLADGAVVSSAVLDTSGNATFSNVLLTIGTHPILASYLGDNNFAGSSGALPGGQVVTGPSSTTTTTTVSYSGNPSVLGQSVTFTATISVTGPGTGTPTGSVQFQIDTNSPVTVPLSASTATFTTSSLTVGTHTVTANYLGDGGFAS